VRTFSMIAIAVAFASAPAMAGGKGGGGHASSGQRPQENLSLNYGKVNQTYTAQRDAATGQASGKRQHKPISVVKESGAASPMLRSNSSNNRKGGRYLAQ
jgi:type VI protein secretion system component Hcp